VCCHRMRKFIIRLLQWEVGVGDVELGVARHFVQNYPGEPVLERLKQESKTNLDLLEHEIVSGTVISWAICKSAP